MLRTLHSFGANRKVTDQFSFSVIPLSGVQPHRQICDVIRSRTLASTLQSLPAQRENSSPRADNKQHQSQNTSKVVIVFLPPSYVEAKNLCREPTCPTNCRCPSQLRSPTHTIQNFFWSRLRVLRESKVSLISWLGVGIVPDVAATVHTPH